MGTHPSDNATLAPALPALPVARNTALLSAALASHSAMLSLTAAVASITLVEVLEVNWLLGLGPAIVLAAGALVALPAGRSMDRFGRVPVLVDRIGRARCLATGLLGMGLSVSSLPWVQSVHATAAARFGLGLGWNLSFVAATAVLADRTKPWERGSLLGFNSDSSRRSS